MKKMEKLLSLLASQDDLPFRTNINEQLVLDAIIEANGTINNDMKNKIKQWIKFNKGINTYEEEPYQTWVHEIYSKIIVLLNI
jgi:hypothetical protein